MHLPRRCISINQFVKRAFLLGLVVLLLCGLVPGSIPLVSASNSHGPTLAAWMAIDLIGTPHRYGGEDPTGVDNSGLVYYVFRQLGVDVPRTVASLAKVGSYIKRSELMTGDLVFFASPSADAVVHVGIYTGNGNFVASASATDGVVQRNLDQAYYSKYYLGARRIDSSDFPPLYEPVAEKARSTIGIRYLSGGSSVAGVDTTGLIRFVYSHYFLSVPSSIPDLAKTGVYVSKSSLRPADLVFFRNADSTRPSLVGIYIGSNQFVMAAESLGGVVVRDFDNSYYSRYYLGARRPYADFVAPVLPEEPAIPEEPTQPGEPGQPEEPAPPANETPSTSVADSLIAEAKKYLGTPYKLGAEGPDYFDCSGFTQYVFDKFGYDLPRASYSQATAGTYVKMDALQKGDLVFFKNTWRNDGRVDHVAIYIGDGKIIHAITSPGVTISNFTGYWVDHYATARRILR